MRTVAIIQARMGSTRLPGKVLMPLAGKPIIGHVHERIAQATRIDRIVIATSTNPADDPLEGYCRESGMDVFRGDEEDVLTRIVKAARTNDADAVVRVTADCPLVEWNYVDHRLEILEREELHLTYCLSSGSVFEGASVWSRQLLEILDRKVLAPQDREHCGLPYALRNLDKLRAAEIHPDPDLNRFEFRLTVDEPVDYTMLSMVFAALYRDGYPIPIWDVVRFLERHPELARLNHAVERKVLDLGGIKKRCTAHP